jgi:hypothetical protein
VIELKLLDPGRHVVRPDNRECEAAIFAPGEELRIPMHRGHLLRFDRGQATDLMAATIPI